MANSSSHHDHRIIDALLDAYPFNESTSILDSACGKGLISRGLAPHCGSIVAVDNNQASVDDFARRISNQGIPPEEMHVVCAQLEGNDSELDGQKFDVVVCSAAYHHLESIPNTTRILAFFLKPGGHLLVVDFLTSAEPIPEDVPHKHGFDDDTIRAAFVGANLADFGMERFATAKFHGKRVELFLARGTKKKVGYS
ncbi:Methyltransf-11 domain-containing protein [Mycena kentingensis (nom. inval.)]|nr:Methyltransf-11 domain-containing protein [Mycena kentingensis (nom. inval.)]